MKNTLLVFLSLMNFTLFSQKSELKPYNYMEGQMYIMRIPDFEYIDINLTASERNDTIREVYVDATKTNSIAIIIRGDDTDTSAYYVGFLYLNDVSYRDSVTPQAHRYVSGETSFGYQVG